MSEYAAEDVSFINARLKEIEAEKQKAREKTADTDTKTEAEKTHHNSPAFW